MLEDIYEIVEWMNPWEIGQEELKITYLVHCPSTQPTIKQKFGLISNGSIHVETMDMKNGVSHFFD